MDLWAVTEPTVEKDFLCLKELSIEPQPSTAKEGRLGELGGDLRSV
jgi:hypothetical protein